MIIIPEIPDICIEDVHVAEEITLMVRTTSLTAMCPCCGTVSKRVQSRYKRTLHDLPASGRPITLIVEVRRFLCKKSTCSRKIFAERLPELCDPYAQRTKRLQEALRGLGLRMGGQEACEAGYEQGMSGSRDTILRLVRKVEPSQPKEPKVIGLDDWAWKRGHRYGTLICDLMSRKPIDLLPDRTAETVSAWLQARPSIDIVSRDGSSEYAKAIKKGAPQAKQVNDRWHMVKNLAKCVSVQIVKTLEKLRRAELAQTNAAIEEKQRDEEPHQRPTRTVARAQQVRQAERVARYEQMRMLREQGMKNAEIAERLGVTQRTIQHWLSTADIPYSRPRKPRSRLIDPYKNYILSRWQQGCSGAELERELKAKGYKGSGRAMYRYLETLEPTGPSSRERSSAQVTGQAQSCQANPLLALSVPQATWLFFRKDEDLKAQERENREQLRQASPEIETTYQLVDKFLRMVRERTGEQLDAWLDEVKASQLDAFDAFVKGIQQDKDAVVAGLTLPWSNGPLEGNVNRLKLIKRSMYGRAQFDLLKIRVLSPGKKRQKKKKGHTNRERTMPKNITFYHTTVDISEVA